MPRLQQRWEFLQSGSRSSGHGIETWVRPKISPFPTRWEGPKIAPPGRREHSAVVANVRGKKQGAVYLEHSIEATIGIHIPHNTIHKILKENGIAESHPQKSKRRKWVRFERTYSNSMWHTDHKQLDDGRWFLCYLDDASRFITGYGVFSEATGIHALEVLHDAIKNHGKPASILTDHGSQFYAVEAECRKHGETEFEKTLAEMDIKHILARVRHPQTNGKLERFHEELQYQLPGFVESSAEKTSRIPSSQTQYHGDIFHTAGAEDPVKRMADWYNYERTHMSLLKGETPAQAFVRKMAPHG